ncbi:MAG TPA: NAD(P)-dependent alcohol dehydrogenase [Burkholderiales bacterium]|nr:NAD(P)-dependent alcohol dehydrogenase [Burkholderiales bacterium]
MPRIRAWAARTPRAPLERYDFAPGPLATEDVEIAVEYCGICHSDLSMLDNEWGMTQYPLVPGHEVIGRVVAIGEDVKGMKVGQRVGVGWNAGSCTQCRSCLSGDQHLCGQVQPTIVGRHGGFADRLRVNWLWAVPMPAALDASSAGPLMCGGLTVFYPLLSANLSPMSRVGVVGIGGLGHMALQFLNAWGCEIVAFTSSAAKREEALALGAHRVVSSTDSAAMQALNGSLDLILYTVNVSLDWEALMATLAPKGRLHLVGAVLEPIPVQAMQLISYEQSISGSPTGPRHAMDAMLDFAARHNIAPRVEHFPMSEVNAALRHLREGKPHYRIVLDADFG